jgi:hypothetical protein
MIRFSLRCEREHAFDSWFRDGDSYDELSGGGHLSCPECGSTKVTKGLMAPAVVTSRKRAIAVPVAQSEPTVPSPSPETQAVALADERARMLRTALREMRDHMVSQSRDVGDAFAVEARRMHEGDTEAAAIRGTATSDDVRALLEDGIEVMPIPTFPDERN